MITTYKRYYCILGKHKKTLKLLQTIKEFINEAWYKKNSKCGLVKKKN